MGGLLRNLYFLVIGCVVVSGTWIAVQDRMMYWNDEQFCWIHLFVSPLPPIASPEGHVYSYEAVAKDSVG